MEPAAPSVPARRDGSPGGDTAGRDIPPADRLAEIRIIAAHPDIAQQVVRLLRQAFRSDEPRSYPAEGGGTLVHLTVDTAHGAAPVSPEPLWLLTSDSETRRTHTDEPG